MWEVNENLKYLRKKNGLTQDALAKQLGIKRSLLGAYEEKRSKIKPEIIKIASDFFKVNPEQFTNKKMDGSEPEFFFSKQDQDRITKSEPEINPEFKPEIKQEINPPIVQQAVFSKTDQFAKPTELMDSGHSDKPVHNVKPQNETYFTGKKIRTLSVTVDREDRFNIEFISAENSDAYTRHFAEPEFLEALPKFGLPFLPRLPAHRVFEITDWAVSSITKGTLAICEYVKNWYSLNSDSVYVIITSFNGICCRKIQNHIQHKGILTLRSENPDFDKLNLTVDQIHEIWEVKSLLNHLAIQPEPKPVRHQRLF